MRQKRAKTYRRVMALYTQTFGFRTPFQILVCNDLILATNPEYDLLKLLTSCVQAEVKPMMTQCCIEALYKLGRTYQLSVDLAKTFERRRCNHREAIEPDDCVKDVIGPTNKHRYVLAAQSNLLRQAVQTVPGLPILHFNPRGVLVLSPPSRATMKHKVTVEEERRMEGGNVLEGLEEGGNAVGSSSSAATTVGKRRRKAPNPMSVRKKKVPELSVVSGSGFTGDVGKRKRVREEDEPRRQLVQGEDVVGLEEGDEGDGTGKRKRKRKKRGKGAVVGEAVEIEATASAVDSD